MLDAEILIAEEIDKIIKKHNEKEQHKGASAQKVIAENIAILRNKKEEYFIEETTRMRYDNVLLQC